MSILDYFRSKDQFEKFLSDVNKLVKDYRGILHERSIKRFQKESKMAVRFTRGKEVSQPQEYTLISSTDIKRPDKYRHIRDEATMIEWIKFEESEKVFKEFKIQIERLLEEHFK